MAQRFTYIPNRVIDTNGIADGASIYVYQTGTTTPVSIYSNSALSTPVSNPYVVASGAAVPELYYSESTVRVKVVGSDGATISDNDPYERPVTQIEIASTTAGQGAGLIGTTSGDTVQDALDELDPIRDNPILARGLLTTSSSVLFLTDSIGNSTGATTYFKGMSHLIAKAILNANDHGFSDPAGYGYYTIINQQSATIEAAAATTGSYDASGVVGSRLKLDAGEYYEVDGRQLAGYDVIYDADASTATHFRFILNGVQVGSDKALSGTGLQNTFQTQLLAGANTALTDTVRIEAIGGTAYITGFLPLRQTTVDPPLIYVASQSGTAYQDFSSSADLDELAYYLNLFRSGSPKVMVFLLGTNNIYAPSKALSPAATVDALDDVITGITSRCDDITFVIQVPPLSDPDIWPVVLDYEHSDYVDALRTYARENGHFLIHQELAGVENYLDDGVHPNDAGHLVMASTVTGAFGLPFNPSTKQVPATADSGTATNVTAGSGFTQPGTAENMKVTKYGPLVTSRGFLNKDTPATLTASQTVAVVPASYRPIIRQWNPRLLVFQSSDSTFEEIECYVDTNGNVVTLEVSTKTCNRLYLYDTWTTI